MYDDLSEGTSFVSAWTLYCEGTARAHLHVLTQQRKDAPVNLTGAKTQKKYINKYLARFGGSPSSEMSGIRHDNGASSKFPSPSPSKRVSGEFVCEVVV